MNSISFLQISGIAMSTLMLTVYGGVFVYALTQLSKTRIPALLVMFSVFIFGCLELAYNIVPMLISRLAGSDGFQMWYGLFQIAGGCGRVVGFGLLFAAVFAGRRKESKITSLPTPNSNPLMDPAGNPTEPIDNSNPYSPS